MKRTLLIALVGLVALSSCSETQRPVDWQNGARGPLRVIADTVVTDTSVVENANYHQPLRTGDSDFFMVGSITRAAPRAMTLHARAYLRWDVSDLPEGDVVAAHLEFLLRGLEQVTATDPGAFHVRMYRLLTEWDEGDIGMVAGPDIGPQIGFSETFDISEVSDSLDVLFTDLWPEAPTADLVEEWREASDENYGIALQIVEGPSEEGYMRFISREGLPRGVETDIGTPLLVVKVRVSPDSVATISMEPEADGYDFLEESRLPAPFFPSTEDTVHLLSSGYAHRLVMRLDLEALREAEPERFPLGLGVHSATLRLTTILGADWSLAADQEMDVGVYETTDAWSEGEPIDSLIITGDFISETTIAATDSVIDFSIRIPAQRLFEGSDLSLVFLSAREADLFRSVLVKSRHAAQGAPELTLYFTPPGDSRIGSDPQGTSIAGETP